MASELKEIEKFIPVISSERKYWFIRTEGGQLFDLFRLENFVAVGYEKIKAEELNQISKAADIREALKKLVVHHYPDHERPGLIVTQIYRFFFEVKKGDIVIIPNHGSEKLLFGEITNNKISSSKAYDKEREKNYSFELSRSVRWEKSRDRYELNPKLYSLFFSHHTISSGDSYGTYIDNELQDFYSKDGLTHLLIPIRKEGDINARGLSRLCLDLLDLTDEFLKENNIQAETDDIKIKSNINSPGTIELIGACSLGLIALGMFIIGLSGGTYTYEQKDNKGKINSPGLIKKLTDFYVQHKKFKIIEGLVKDLKVSGAEDLREVIKKLPPK